MNSCPIRCASVIDASRCSAQAVAGEGETIGGEDVIDGVALVVALGDALVVAPGEPVAAGEPDSTAGAVALGLAAMQAAAITALSPRLSQQGSCR